MVSYRKKKLIIIFLIMFSFMNKSLAKYENTFYDFNIKSIDGNNIELKEYKNKAVLVCPILGIASN